MEMKRRSFLGRTVQAGAVLAVPLIWLAERTLPIRYVEALRSRFYPGPRKPLHPADIARPGHWEG